MGDDGGLIARLRNPEYTGENRCLPCTVVNVGIAVVVSTQVAAWGLLADAPGVGAAAGTGLLVCSLCSVWLRGYLVPGTPTLTERFPDPVLAFFKGSPPSVPRGVTGRASAATDGGVAAAADPVDAGADGGSAGPVATTTGDPATRLGDADVLDADGRPTDEFLAAWDRRVADGERSGAGDGDRTGERTAERGPAARASSLADRFGLDGDVTVRPLGRGAVASVDGERVGAWESGLALRSDLAAAALLADRVDGWEALSTAERGRLCVALRERRETCPACGGTLSTGPVTVRSCCGSLDVRATECVGCEARLVETGR